MNLPRLILQISKGLIREQRARRTVMFYSVLAALVLLFGGATQLGDWLRAHPFTFLFYWAACGWITLLAVLLALFDLLVVRARMRREQRRLAAAYLAESKGRPPHDPKPR